MSDDIKDDERKTASGDEGNDNNEGNDDNNQQPKEITNNNEGIDLIELEKILKIGQNFLCEKESDCNLPLIYDIKEKKSFLNPSYIYGEKAKDIYTYCFQNPSDNILCNARICKYSDQNKKMSKEAHGKTFESNINDTIASYFFKEDNNNNNSKDNSKKINYDGYIRNIKESGIKLTNHIELPSFHYVFRPLLEHMNDPLDVTTEHFCHINVPIIHNKNYNGQLNIDKLKNKQYIHPKHPIILNVDEKNKDYINTKKYKKILKKSYG